MALSVRQSRSAADTEVACTVSVPSARQWAPLASALSSIAAVLLFACAASSVSAQKDKSRAVLLGDLLDLCGQPHPLQSGLNNCATSQSIPMNSVQQFSLEVEPGATFTLVVQLRSTYGDADLEVVGPVGPKNRTWTSTERIGEDYINVTRLDLQDTPGTYLINVVGYTTMTFYQLSIQTSSLTLLPNLDPAEQYVLWNVYKTCCVQDDYTNSSTCNRLAQATAPGHTRDQDMCNIAPNVCDSDGHLIRLTLSGDSTGNFVCNGSFPWQFGNFTRLQSLDLSHNSIIAPITAVADTVTKLTNLQKLYLGNNLLNGTFDCRLAQMPSLQVLWLSRNLIHGSLPSCLFQSSVLTQIDLSQNLLLGPLPPFPLNSRLQTVDFSDNGMPDGPGNGPGLSGRIPSTIINAKDLQYLALQGNSLTGSIPELPPNLNTLILASNRLVGQIPLNLGHSSILEQSNLRIVNVSKNLLTGSLPPGIPRIPALQTLDVSSNQLTAGLNALWSTEYLVELNVSNNNFAEHVPSSLATLDQLRSMDVSSNRLAGGLLPFAASLLGTGGSSSLLAFDVSDNLLTGTLPAALAAMQMFKVPSQAVANTATGSQALLTSFKVGGNRFSGVFPQWLMVALAGTYDLSNTASVVLKVRVNGGSNNFSCPAPVTSAAQLLPALVYLQQLYNLTCFRQASQQAVLLTRALDYEAFAKPPPPLEGAQPPPAAAAVHTAPPPPPAVAATATTSEKKKGGAGAAIGGAIAAVLVASIVAGLGYWYWRQRSSLRPGDGSTANGGIGRRDTPLTFNNVYELEGEQAFSHFDSEAGFGAPGDRHKFR